MYDDENDGGLRWFSEIGQFEEERTIPQKTATKAKSADEQILPILEEMER